MRPNDGIWRHELISIGVGDCLFVVWRHQYSTRKCWHVFQVYSKGHISMHFRWIYSAFKLYKCFWYYSMKQGHRPRSSLDQVTACSMTAPIHGLNQGRLIIPKVQWQSTKRYLSQLSLKSCWKLRTKIPFKSPREQRVKTFVLNHPSSDHTLF